MGRRRHIYADRNTCSFRTYTFVFLFIVLVVDVFRKLWCYGGRERVMPWPLTVVARHAIRFGTGTSF